MRRILSKNKLRQLQLLEMLGTDQKGQKIDDLAKHFQVTRQTITRDFEYINQKMESAGIVDDQGYYRAVFLRKNCIQTIYNEILDNDTGFQIFEVIFYDESLSVEEVAKKIDASTSTVYKIIENIREPLDELFNLSIATRPVHLTGRERDIRSFYNQYFAEKYNHFTLKMDLPITPEAFEGFIQSGAELVGRDFTFTYHHFYKIVVGVNMIRYLQGHYLEAEFKDLTTYIEALRADEQLIQSIEQTFPGEFSDFAIYQLLGQFAFKHYFCTYEGYKQAVSENQIIGFSQSILEETVQTIAERYHIDCPNADELYWKMNQTANQAELDYLAIPLLSKRKERFAEDARALNPSLFDYIQSRLELYAKLMNIRWSQPMRRHLITTFYILWEGFVPSINSLKAPVKILVVSHYRINHAKMIRDVLNTHFNHLVEVQIYDEKELDMDHLLEQDYEVLVSNFRINHLDDRPSVMIGDFLHTEDLKQIYACCKQVQNRKYE